LAKDVLVCYLGDETRFLAALKRGIAGAERGEFIEEEEMDARASLKTFVAPSVFYLRPDHVLPLAC
jgi:predicted transcriptional regulator